MTSSICCSDNTDFHAGIEVPARPSRITFLKRVLVMVFITGECTRSRGWGSMKLPIQLVSLYSAVPLA